MSIPLPRVGLGAAERHVSPARWELVPAAGPLLGDAEQESPGKKKKKKKNKRGLKKNISR